MLSNRCAQERRSPARLAEVNQPQADRSCLLLTRFNLVVRIEPWNFRETIVFRG
jgi:hypothetical protein